MPQQLAHATSNGAAMCAPANDGLGTDPGLRARQRGSLIELTWNGRDPLRLNDGSERTFLEDGDEVVPRGKPLGEVRGRIVAA